MTPEQKDAAEVEPFVIRLEDTHGPDGQKAVRIINEGPATLDKGAQTRMKILEALSSTSGRTVKDVAEALKLHINTIKASLAADGAVHKRGNVGEADLWWLSA